jgi:hypothetical protein
MARFLLAGALLLLTTASVATTFGRSKVQTTLPDWWELRSQNATVYYPRGSEEAAESLMVIATAELAELGRYFGYMPDHPVPIVLYSSPSTFRQTNISTAEIGEGVGGFTEFFKGRVVVPYTGYWSEFRHVVEHEINHAFVLDMLYSMSIQDIVRSRAPLWTMEGLAEYTSLGWDRESEAEFRDMVIAGSIASIQELSRRADYLVYRQGQAIYHFIASRYGDERLRRFVRALRGSGLEKALDEALGMSVEQLNQRFLEWARETYWAELAWRESPDDVGRPVGRGERLQVASPFVSPDGRYVAGVEPHHARFALTVRSTVDGEVEERIFTGGGLYDVDITPMYRAGGFSPGSDTLAYVYHHLDGDRLAIRGLAGEGRELDVRMDLLREPTWSPDGRYIAFGGMDDGQLDVYVHDLLTGGTSRLTETHAGERDLSWSSRGLIFVQEASYGDSARVLLADRREILDTLITGGPALRHPIATDDGLLFLSDRDGYPDIYLRTNEGAVNRLTALYRSVESLSWADSLEALAFAASDWSGRNVFIADDITDRRVSVARGEGLEVTSGGDGEAGPPDHTAQVPPEHRRPPARTHRPRTHAPVPDSVSAPSAGRGSGGREAGQSSAAPAERAAGGLRVAPYEPRLSLDYVNALASFDSYLGLAGYTQFLFSDVLAHHRLMVNVNLNGDVTDADAVVGYSFLPYRTDFGGTLYRTTRRYLFRFDDGHLEEVRDVDMGAAAGASYPVSEALSLRAETGYRSISRQGVWNSEADYGANVTYAAAALVFDNARWGYVGPRVGTRLKLGMEAAPDLLDSTNYYLASADLRTYTWVSSRVTLAMRLAGATSWGRDAPVYFIGGAVPHRLIWGEVDEVSDVLGFYANYADMLRGYDYGDLEGRRYVTSTVEMRVPFIDRLSLAAPIPMTLSNGRGVLFIDAGTAFNDPDSFHGASTDRGYELDDIKAGIGFGFRINLGYFVLREDTAWRTTIRGISAKPEHYFALGAEF